MIEGEVLDYEEPIPVVEFTRLRCPYCGDRDSQRIYAKSPKGHVYVRCGVCCRPHADRRADGKVELSGQPTRYAVTAQQAKMDGKYRAIVK